jgi:hypothetical protein
VIKGDNERMRKTGKPGGELLLKIPKPETTISKLCTTPKGYQTGINWFKKTSK